MTNNKNKKNHNKYLTKLLEYCLKEMSRKDCTEFEYQQYEHMTESIYALRRFYGDFGEHD